jgi:hypothetical protein
MRSQEEETMFDNVEQAAVRGRIVELRQEHRALDDAITVLSGNPSIDQIQLRRLKKRKLYLRDVIAHLESQLIPDLEA